MLNLSNLMFDFTQALTLIENTPIVAYSFVMIFGLCIGSFLNVVIYRLPTMLNQQWQNQAENFLNLPSTDTKKISLMTPRSTCQQCNSEIYWYHNIPIISWALLKGKCAYCSNRISPQYLFIEILTAAVFVINYVYFGLSLSFLFANCFVCFILCLALIDLKTYLLPDELTLSLLWIGIIASYYHLFNTSLSESILAVLIAYCLLRSLATLFYWITKKEGMGFGDFKYLAALVAWLGYSSIMQILLIASLTGILYSGFLWLKNSKKVPMIPFGPFLSIGGIVIFYQQATLTMVSNPIPFL